MIDRGPIVIYNSATGFTAKYALWIAEKLECPFISFKEADVKALRHYETIIYGGWLSAGKVIGLELIKRNIKEFEGQNIVVFAVGAIPAEMQDMNKLKLDNLTDGLERKPFFFFPGGLNYERLGFVNRMLTKALRSIMKKKGYPEMAEMISHSFDNSSPDYVDPLVSYVKQITTIHEETAEEADSDDRVKL